LINLPNFSLYINSQTNTKNLIGQNKTENKMSNAGSYRCYNGIAKGGEEGEKKVPN
jgi:hypothetical protein